MVKGNTRRNSRHHQSLVTISRRHSLLRSLSTLNVNDSSPSHNQPPLERGMSLSPRRSLSRQGSVVEHMERDTCRLEPKLEGRIVVIHNEEVHISRFNCKRNSWLC